MSRLDQKFKELIAISASIAANCQPWLETHYSNARAAGADNEEIREAIDIGEMIKETVIMNSRISIDLIIKELDTGEETKRSPVSNPGWKF